MQVLNLFRRSCKDVSQFVWRIVWPRCMVIGGLIKLYLAWAVAARLVQD